MRLNDVDTNNVKKTKPVKKSQNTKVLENFLPEKWKTPSDNELAEIPGITPDLYPYARMMYHADPEGFKKWKNE